MTDLRDLYEVYVDDMRDLNAVAGRISRMSKKASHLRVAK